MHAGDSDIKNLLELQKIDAEIKSSFASLETTPQVSHLREVLGKIKEATMKKKQVEALKLDCDKRIEKMGIEDVTLAKRERSVQEAIDEAVGDFRNLEVHTKELDGISKRRESLTEMLLTASVEQEKIQGVLKKLDDAILKLEEKKDKLEAEIETNKNEVLAKVSSLNEKRDELKSSTDGALVDLYEQSTKKVGSVVIGKVEDGSCSVCKTKIEDGKLIDMQNNGEVAICPSCSRILILK